jgi:hypothetical protein
MNKTLYWLPRILSILFILFLSLFSLDIFDSCNSFFSCALGLIMHNVPVFILIVLLVFSWKREWLGGVVFILGGLLYIFMLLMNPVFEWYMISWSITIAGPSFIVGILWLLNWKARKNEKRTNKKEVRKKKR